MAEVRGKPLDPIEILDKAFMEILDGKDGLSDEELLDALVKVSDAECWILAGGENV
jgi:hypothetical protein